MGIIFLNGFCGERMWKSDVSASDYLFEMNEFNYNINNTVLLS